jgi:hypothetical protein
MALGRGSQLHRVRCSAPDLGVVRNKAYKFKESVGVTVDRLTQNAMTADTGTLFHHFMIIERSRGLSWHLEQVRVC